MPGNYRHIMQYEKEMMKLKEEGVTVREIGERFGLNICSYCKKNSAMEIGVVLFF